MWIGQYILGNDGKPVPEPDMLKWAVWLEEIENRIVRHDHFGEILVSTVFLGLDHHFPPDEPHEPLLWETMILGGEHDNYQRRYTSRAAAEAGHLEALKLIGAWQKDVAELNRIMGIK